MTDQNIVPFGKYRGKPIESLAEDRQYLDWLLSQAWFREKHGDMYTVIVNNFREPSETPEHNALQVLFLDDAFCRGLCHVPSFKSVLTHFIQSRIEEWLEYHKDELKHYTDALIGQEDGWCQTAYRRPGGGDDRAFHGKRLTVSEAETHILKLNEEIKRVESYSNNKTSDITFLSRRQFEYHGWDVAFRIEIAATTYPEFLSAGYLILIEIKPSLGDDYPAILRQIKSRPAERSYDCRQLLVYDQFTAAGATLDQIKSIFETSGITVVSIADIKGDQS